MLQELLTIGADLYALMGRILSDPDQVGFMVIMAVIVVVAIVWGFWGGYGGQDPRGRRG